MSHLDIPRLTFAGRFYADPSTIDNNRNNFNLGLPLNEDPIGPNNNYSVGWNPHGSHVFRFDGCTVQSVDVGKGPSAADPLIKGNVESTLDVFRYPAKLVDLDPDQQSVSQIWGLAVRVTASDPTGSGKPPARVTGVMPPTAFADMWTRVAGKAHGMPYFSAVFTSLLTDLKWENAEQSPVLARLAAVSPKRLALRLIVDSYQPRATERTFGFGRLVGTLGPSADGEPQRFVAGRRLSAAPIGGNNPSPPYGPVPAILDAAGGRLTLDLGNFVPTVISAGSAAVPADGWPIRPSTFSLRVSPPPRTALTPARSVSPKAVDVEVVAAGPLLATIPFNPADYPATAGVVTVPLTADQIKLVAAAPLQLLDETGGNSTVAVAEDPGGLYVDVSETVFRLNPNESATVTLTALRFGKPAAGVVLDLAYQPQGASDPNNYPTQGLPIPNSLTTGPDGTATLKLTAGNTSGARRDMNIDGQVYFIGGTWTGYGNLFPLQSAPINVLVFDRYVVPATPTWAEHVGPILSY